MVCRNCGATNANGGRFCESCGADLSVMTAPSAPTYAPVYGTPAYGVPYGAPIVPGKGLGIAGMVLGIIALVLFCVWYIAIPCAIIGVALSGIGLNKAKEAGMRNSMAVAGVTCSCIALGIAIIFIIYALAVYGAVTSSLAAIF